MISNTISQPVVSAPVKPIRNVIAIKIVPMALPNSPIIKTGLRPIASLFLPQYGDAKISDRFANEKANPNCNSVSPIERAIGATMINSSDCPIAKMTTPPARINFPLLYAALSSATPIVM
jgi:hypothetical protein